MDKNKKNINIYKFALTAMLSAVAYVLFLLEIPWISFGFLKYDLSDIAALVGGIFIGPVSGVVIELVKNVIHLANSTTGGFGEAMNFIVGSSYIVPFVLCYNAFSKKIKKSIAVLIGAIIGCVVMIILGAIGNYFIAPLYFKVVLNQVYEQSFWVDYLICATSLNAVKGVILSAISYLTVFTLVDKLKKVAKL